MGTRKNPLRTQTVWLAALDAACLVLAVILGVKLRHLLGLYDVFEPLVEETLGQYVRGHIDGWVYFCGAIILANYVVGSYGIRITTCRFNLLVNWLFSLMVALLVLGITNYAWFTFLLGRGVLLMSMIAYAVLSLLSKLLLYSVVFRSQFFVYHVAVLGCGQRAREIREVVEGAHILPSHKVTAYLRPGRAGDDAVDADAGDSTSPATIDGVATITATEESLEDIVNSLDVDLVVVAISDIKDASRFYPVLRRVRLGGVEVLDALTAMEAYSGRVLLDMVDDRWLTQASMLPSLAVVARFKRMFDILAAILGVAIGIPLGLLVMLAIKLSAPLSPVFYSQKRVGQFGKVFRMYKFRTMVVGAEDDVGPVWATDHDVRVTRLGRVLRKFRLDEIPQVVNIMDGDMSVVGPRPERPELVLELEQQIPYYRERENIPPGLTGWAQVQYPYTDNVEDTARKLEFDLYYLKHLSLKLDLQIILRTLRIVLLGKERLIFDKGSIAAS